MPNIAISEESLATLQRYAVPLVDTVDTAIKKMDELIRNGATAAASQNTSVSATRAGRSTKASAAMGTAAPIASTPTAG